MIPSVGYTIRHWSDGSFEPMAAGDGTFMLRDTFDVHQGRETNWCVFRVLIHLTADAHSFAWPQFVAQHGEANFREAALIWAVDCIERGLRGGRFKEGSIRLDLDVADFQPLQRIVQEKRCSYQIRQARDLFCSAHSPSESFAAVGKIGLLTVSATSEHECLDCPLPDARFLCSQLQHPKVAVQQALMTRLLRDGKCGRNRAEVKEAALCHAGGHGCWEYQVVPQEEDNPPAYVSPGLTRALDFLDTAWGLRFGKTRRLVGMASAMSMAALERDCATEQDFADRVIALGDVLGALSIPDSLTDARGGDALKGSLIRLGTVLEKHLADDAHRARALEAVQKLRAANDLRSSTAHSGFNAREKRLKAETSLAIRFYPDVSWSDTWNQLRARLTEALRTIAAPLQELSKV